MKWADSVTDGDDATSRTQLPGNPVAGFAGQVLVHPSHLCQIGESDQGHFPQIDGLVHSSTARLYVIKSQDEAAAYLAHPVLRPCLIECCEALLLHPDRSARDILGSPDDLKLRSCATPFAHIQPGHQVFGRILDAFYTGGPDHRTVELLRGND